MIQAAVCRSSEFELEPARTICGYHRDTSRLCDMRSPTCTRACCACRGWAVSAKYLSISESSSGRPNQVLYQKRKGNSTSSSANPVIIRYARLPGLRLWDMEGDNYITTLPAFHCCSNCW